MKRASKFPYMLLAAVVLGGCSAQIATPWDRKSLDPGQVVTLEPLEIPPDFDTLPKLGPRKDQEPDNTPSWVDSGDDAQTSGAVPSMFKNFSETEQDASKYPSRNEQERLPGWMGSDIDSE